MTPWNKGLSVHLSPTSEFRKGQAAHNKLPIGSVTTRQTKKAVRAFIKIAEPNIWRLLAHVVWEAENGPIPKGFLIHHVDRNTLNDKIENLALLTRGEHLLEHKSEFEQRRLEALRRVLTSDFT